MADSIKTGITLIEEGTPMPESVQFESAPWTSFYTAGGIIRELRKASGKQNNYGSEGKMAHSDEVIDHDNHPCDVDSLPKNDLNGGIGLLGASECGDVMKLRMKFNSETQVTEGAELKTTGCSDICQLFARHRVGQGQDLEKALAIKNTNIVCEVSLPACDHARCNKTLQNWREATPGG